MDDKWLIIGKFGRPHGIKGDIKVISFTNPVENILNYSNWFVRLQGQWQSLKWCQNKNHKNTEIIVNVENYKDREEVAKLSNCEIAILKIDLPKLEQDEYYWHELIGLIVTNQQNIVLGKVTAIMPTGSNDVLVVSGEKRYLIPYLVGQYVIEVDLEKKQILVDWDADF